MDQHHHVITHDQSEVNAKVIFISTVVCTILLVFVFWLSYQFYLGTRSDELNQKEKTTTDFQEKQDALQVAQTALTSAKVPISEAMGRIVQRYSSEK